MKSRWAFYLSLMLGVLAVGIESWYIEQSGEARRQLTEYSMRDSDPDNPPSREIMEADLRAAEASPAKARLRRAEAVASITLPAAAMSGLCLFLSRRRKEPARRWIVGALLISYWYLRTVWG